MKIFRLLCVLALYAGLFGGGLVAGGWLYDWVAMDLRGSEGPQMQRMILVSTVAYVVASALPFVPGAEIGFGMMALLGARIAPIVYLGMVSALTLSYLVGLLVPVRTLEAGLGALGLSGARGLVHHWAGLDTASRLRLLVSRAPIRIVPFLLRHRYLLLALALNLPGNSLIGGGGGIALAAGLSGLYRPAAYLLTIGLAVAPVPLLFLLGGRLIWA